VIVLDAYAVLALLKGEPAAAPVRRLLERNEGASLTVLGLAEVVDHLVRIVGATEEDAALDVAQLGLAEPEPLDAPDAMRAGLLRARQYHRRARAVSLADCVAAETARSSGVRVATADPHLLDLCADEGIGFLALPDSRGNIWHGRSR
jgi:predicted nucleic acid-binding protein